MNGERVLGKTAIVTGGAREIGKAGARRLAAYDLISSAGLPAYHTNKDTAMLMSKTDAICYAPHSIRASSAHLAIVGEKHPLTPSEPEDVANFNVFLASDETRFVTGASLVCDGGYTAQ